MAIEVGKKAPAFTLPASSGDKVRLTELKGKIVVLYFYPKDNTPGCTVEANEFQELLAKFKRAGALVFGVSKDSIESHCKFANKYGLKFPLLTDDSTKMMAKYDAFGEKNMYGRKSMGIIRSTVVIDPNGKVYKHWKRAKSKGHAEKVLEIVREVAKEFKE